MVTFGERLRQLREERGLLQREVADKLNLSRVAITQYEQGRREPELSTIARLANLFGVSVDYLLGRTDKRNSTAPSSGLAETLAASRTDQWTEELPEEARKSLEEFQEYIMRKYAKKKE